MEIVNRRPRKRGLSARDREVLEIEREFGASPEVWPRKAAEAHHRLGLTPNGYTLVLRGLVDDPQAHAAAPDVIDELRRLRDLKS
ncbi:hypothetical protein BJY21_001041 [Kineosphaera limosa]|uniref:DUF3263 domain-containing protein n=1 Tax=Kineosphaera limosa NBRC 100340 TaxID=1184609 RepID=K6VMM3_9MICO|nr:DUF3263 domain-containing protein [Kineosphaera limosa]NYD99856.1 hypothetical protein [Kineosphaera limosa]GAB97468.1 hypothetical protein KILIM_070_00050 [Kineosphaera limosa NBRC 100340]